MAKFKKVTLGSVPKISEFKGDETVRRWENTIEDVLIEIACATDKRGFLIMSDITLLIKSFDDHIKVVRDNMNNDVGDPVTIIPRGY